MEVIMNDLFRTLSRTSDMPVKRCERCGNIADNTFYVKKGTKAHERISHDLCDSCANWLCNFIAFFVTIEDDKLEEIEDIVSYDNPVYEAFVEELMEKEQKAVVKTPEKPAQKSGIKSIPNEVIEAADAFFGALAEGAASISLELWLRVLLLLRARIRARIKTKKRMKIQLSQLLFLLGISSKRILVKRKLSLSRKCRKRQS